MAPLPLVSIIIPTFNRAHFLRETIDSILAQSEQRWELLIVDDGSTDHTQSLIESLAAAENRIRYFYQPHRGVSNARNYGIRHANGKYLAFVDDDDLWMKDKLASQMKALEKYPNAGICITDGVAFSGDQVIKPTLIPKAKKALQTWMKQHPASEEYHHIGNLLEVLLHVNCVIISSVLMRKSLFDELGGFRSACDGWEGYDLWLRASPHTLFLLIDQILLKYRTLSPSFMGSSLEHRSFRTKECDAYALETHLKNIPETHRAFFTSRIAHNYMLAGWYYNKEGDWKRARELWWRSIKQRPFQVKVYLYLIKNFLGALPFLAFLNRIAAPAAVAPPSDNSLQPDSEAG